MFRLVRGSHVVACVLGLGIACWSGIGQAQEAAMQAAPNPAVVGAGAPDAASATPAIPATPAAVPVAPEPTMLPEPTVLEPPKAPTLASRVTLRFFGDASFALDHDEKARTHFGLGQYSMLVRGDLASNFYAEAEPVIEFGDDNAPALDLERLLIRYRTPHFYLQGGRSHIGIGYWNDTYHHGAIKFLPIDRPIVVNFEDHGGLIPAHGIGIEAGVGVPLSSSQDAALWWSGGVSNTRGHTADEIQNLNDGRLDKQLHTRLELRELVPGLRFGVSGVYGFLGGSTAHIALSHEGMHEVIGGAHLAYEGTRVTVMTEGFAVAHVESKSHTSFGAYAIAGYNFQPVTAYVRLERVVMVGEDPYFHPDPLVAASRLLDVTSGGPGVRWDITNWCAAKVEFDAAVYNARDFVPTLRANWAFGI